MRQSKTGRFSLDISKLEEIEALTGSPPNLNFHISSDLSEITELPEMENRITSDNSISLSEILNDKTEHLLERSNTKLCGVPQKANYLTEAELFEEYGKKQKSFSPKKAWQDTEEIMIDLSKKFEVKEENIDETYSSENVNQEKSMNNEVNELIESGFDCREDSSNLSDDIMLHHQLSSSYQVKSSDYPANGAMQEPESRQGKKLSQFTFHLFSSQLAETNLSAKLNDHDIFSIFI